MDEAMRQRARRVFMELADLPPQARSAALDRSCAGDAQLLAEVRALLDAEASAGAFMASPTADAAAPGAAESAGIGTALIREGPGARIGPYKLLQQIGEGGFGSVFMAEQEKPVVRKVALKIIKLGMDTRAVIARFEAERQALAMMDHPSIAKVLDAGATETGRPYFVMELCKGEPIDEYCDKYNLSIPERLALFEEVCQAVQHAHTKGIIHRDIKPSNVLVSTQDGRPRAKVIDFGIAKATASKLTEKTLFTEHRQLIGTPEYMSPEQAEGSLDIDTRTDVYSLGVLLYELLTGTTPFSSKELRSAAYAEIQRIIREVQPPNPSTRLSHNTDTIASVAAKRDVEPRKLGTIVRGELDWIVMKALEKDRARRYETANGLAMDIRRYLAGEAVNAAPPSAAYRAKKFFRRHRVIVTGGAAVGAALLLGAIAFAWQAEVARGQRDLAVSAQTAEAEQRRAADEQRALATEQRDRAIAAEEETKKRADELSKVSEFQDKMLSQIDVTQAGIELMGGIRAKYLAALEKTGVPEDERAARAEAFGLELFRVNATDTASEMIDRTILKPALEAVETQFKEQPVLNARLRFTLAQLYHGLGKTDEAIPLQQQALDIRRAVLGEAHPDTLTSINDMGILLERVGKADEAEAFYKEAFDQRRRVLGEDHPDTLASMGDLGNFYRAAGRFEEAEPLLRGCLEKHRKVLGDESRHTLIVMNKLGFLFVAQGKMDQAEPLWREAYEKGRRALGGEDRDVLVWINNLAGLLQARGKVAEAEPLFRESLEKHRRVLGEDHPGTIRAIYAASGHFRRRGMYDEAEPLTREAFEKSTRLLGPEHPFTLDAALGMGRMLMERGKLAEAEPYFSRTLERRRRVLGPEHADTLVCMGLTAKLFTAQGRAAEAQALYREAMETSRRKLGPEHPDTLILMNNLGGLLMREGQLDEAEPLIREAAATRGRVSGPDHPETLLARTNLARLLELQEKSEEAEVMSRELMTTFQRVQGKDHPDTMNSMTILAHLVRKQGRPAEAEPLYRDAVAGFEGKLGKDHQQTAGARLGLGITLTDLQRFADAESELLKADRAYAAAQGASAANRRQCAEGLAALYTAWDAAEPGKGYDAKAAEWLDNLRQMRPDDPKQSNPAASKDGD